MSCACHSAARELALASFLRGAEPSSPDDARYAFRAGWREAWERLNEATEQSITELTGELELEQQRSAGLQVEIDLMRQQRNEGAK